MAANILAGDEFKVLLNNKNYKKWRVCMKGYLLAQNLWDVVKPSKSKSDKSSNTDVWQTKNAAAFDAILKSCGTAFQDFFFFWTVPRWKT